MPLSLAKFIDRIENFRKLSDPEKIKFFAWYLHKARGKSRIVNSDFRHCYDELHIEVPNLSKNLSRLETRKPKVLLKDREGYYLEGHLRSSIDAAHETAVLDVLPVEVIDHVLPESIVQGTKPYLEKLALQINGCFHCHFYDGCAVLMRRMIECLLIDVFIKVSHVDKIRDGNKFKMLDGILTVAKSNQYLILARGSDVILDDVKYLGDRSAHNRNYIASKNDIADLTPRFRTIISELLTLADIHPTLATT